MDDRISDRPAQVAVSAPDLIADGYCRYERYRLTLVEDNGVTAAQTRDTLRAGKVAAVLALDLGRDEIVLIRQFRLPAYLANGKGELIETVAGRVELGETPAAAARRECEEEIGVTPSALAELFTYLTSPGLTDEEVTVFAVAVDATKVPPNTASGGEQIETMRVPVDAALAALAQGTMRNGPLLIALQWLALNRARVAALLSKP